MGLLPSIASTLSFSIPAGPVGMVWGLVVLTIYSSRNLFSECDFAKNYQTVSALNQLELLILDADLIGTAGFLHPCSFSSYQLQWQTLVQQCLLLEACIGGLTSLLPRKQETPSAFSSVIQIPLA